MYKIGVGEIKGRLSALQVGCPYPLEAIAFIQIDEAFDLEDDLHAAYDPKNIRGEWFKLTVSDILDILDYGESHGGQSFLYIDLEDDTIQERILKREIADLNTQERILWREIADLNTQERILWREIADLKTEKERLEVIKTIREEEVIKLDKMLGVLADIKKEFPPVSLLARQQLDVVFTKAEIRDLDAYQNGKPYTRQNLYRARKKFKKFKDLFGYEPSPYIGNDP